MLQRSVLEFLSDRVDHSFFKEMYQNKIDKEKSFELQIEFS